MTNEQEPRPSLDMNKGQEIFISLNTITTIIRQSPLLEAQRADLLRKLSSNNHEESLALHSLKGLAQLEYLLDIESDPEAKPAIGQRLQEVFNRVQEEKLQQEQFLHELEGALGLESDLQETADQRNIIISRRVLQLKDEKEEAEQDKEETKEDAETRDEATQKLLSETIQTVFRLIGVDPMDLSAIERCDLASKLKELGITLSGKTLDIVVEDFNLAGLKESKDQSGNS